jgi:hypothetical protein
LHSGAFDVVQFDKVSALMTHSFQATKPPNKAPEPTPTAVTPRASSPMMKMKQLKVDCHVARGAPAAVVAHL